VSEPKPLHGLLAIFAEPEPLVAAAHAVRAQGYRRLDAYTPFPVEGLAEALGVRAGLLPWIILAAAVAGGVAGYLLQYYSVMIAYPINVGGRPLHSWPSFLIITFEMTILGGTLGALFGMLILNRLPAYHHPIFGASGFSFGEGDRFYLCIEASDDHFDRARSRALLESLGPLQVEEVAS
jgi:hypothetical protein